MKYKTKQGIYDSSIAARSKHQKQVDLVQILSKFSTHDMVLDYGCGKLRYFDELRKLSKNLYLLDSDIQLFKKQQIQGERTSVNEYCQKFKNVHPLTIDKIEAYQNRFDLILLANVLSAIPVYKVRVQVLDNINKLLNESGKAIIVLQYKDTYFKQYKEREGAQLQNQGYIFKTQNQVRYYAMLDDKEMKKLFSKTKLKIESITKRRGRLFIEVKKGST